MKPRMRPAFGAWACWLPGTKFVALAETPKAAYLAWQYLLRKVSSR